ncbi:hypothetical protein M9Y10_030825 [Tritrichomonas musculus]|uniref:Uncharacterized protein n=1 Tax=Tritrichomonas musculus TaxID=1915356 RepID=A0ABR2H2Z2_9EUKA
MKYYRNFWNRIFLVFIVTFSFVLFFFYHFDHQVVASFFFSTKLISLNLFYQNFDKGSLFWGNLSNYNPYVINEALNVLFPNVAEKPKKIERSLIYDKDKQLSQKEYVDNHTKWPDRSFKLNAPNYQKTGLDVIPGIKDVLHLIYKHQHPQSCKNKKFLAPSSPYSGFGSVIHTVGALLGIAMMNDRILVWGEYDIIWSDGPFCGGKTNPMQQEFIDKQKKRSHTGKSRKYHYYKKPINNFDCFFQPITNCTIKNYSKDVDIKYEYLSDNHIVPDIIVPIIKRLKIPEDLSYFYWRLCSTAYLYRVNEVARKWVKEIEEDFLVNPVDNYDVSVHVRRGDKGAEMTLVDGNDCMVALKMIKKILNKDRLNVFLSSEDQNIIDWFLHQTNESITYFDFQLDNLGFEESMTLGSVLVPQMLANIKHSLFSTFVIGTIGSNWNRLLLELRMTTAGYANNYFFEIGDHECVSLEHCKFKEMNFNMNW